MLEIGLRKTAVLRVHVALVACIHALNALAVWFRYVVGDFVGRDTFIAFFSVSSEGKLPTWFSAATLLFCGALLGLIAISAYRERDPYRLHWLGLSALFLYMSFDEATEVHEMLGPLATSALGISSAVLSGWVVPAAICLGVLSVLYVSFVAHLAPRSRMLFLGAGAAYVFGALGMELAGNAYTASNPRDLGYGILATVEEIFEMGGIVMFVYALLDYLGTGARQRVEVVFS